MAKRAGGEREITVRKKCPQRANRRPEMPENLMSVTDVAKETGYSRQTIYIWLFKGKLTKYKNGRFVAVDIEEARNLVRNQRWKEIKK